MASWLCAVCPAQLAEDAEEVQGEICLGAVLPKLLGSHHGPAGEKPSPSEDECRRDRAFSENDERCGPAVEKPSPSEDECRRDRAFSEKDERLLKRAHRTWLRQQKTIDLARKQEEFTALLRQTRAQMLRGSSIGHGHMPANRYGGDAQLPQFDPEVHVPTLALINPHSGAMAGLDILSVARSTPYYQRRFFNIIDVVRDQRRGGLLDLFRVELNAAKEEAKARGLRARVISGGGDGTASFALFIVFAALRADESRAEEGLQDSGNGFIWSDEELAECFPALAQMPLGSANDFAHTLGWGHKYPGDQSRSACIRSRTRSEAALRGLRSWIGAVVSPASKVVNFDLWGIMPAPGTQSCNFKVCELGGPRGQDPKVAIDGQKQLLMKEASTPVPLFLCLYFSAGFGAYMTARFQLNRRKTPLFNKLEYARQAAGIIAEPMPPQLRAGLEGVEISCGSEHYFPPRSVDGTGGSAYREVGFLNINWQAGMAHGADRAPLPGRLCSTREPAKFNDEKMDMYRLKLTSPLKNPGLRYQTDKKGGPMTMTYAAGRGKGLFFQWDGEARFAFSPSGDPFSIDVRKILNIPVVLGPGYEAGITGEPDDGRQARFEFAGEAPSDREAVGSRILRCVAGELDAEVNATREELLQAGFHLEAQR